MAIAGSLVVTVTARTQDFENGMRKTTATLKLTEQQAASVTQAFNGLGASLSTASSKSQTMAQSTATMNRQLKDTGGVMGEIKQQLTGLVAGFVAFSALKAGVTGVVDAALKQERLVSILTAVTGSQQKASEAMAFARAEAERFGVAMNAATEGYARLLGATKSTVLEGQRTREMYSNILAVMSTFKVSAEDQNDILRATTQILQQQAIQGDELKNEIGSRIPIMQKLVEASNGAFKTQLEFNKAMEEGKLKGEAASAIMYNLFQIMARESTKAGAAGQGAAAEFARFNNTIQELKEAIGVGLLPALGEAARALVAFMSVGKDAAGVFGGEFNEVIRQATSVLIGLAGAFVVTGKAMAAFTAGLIGDTEAARIGWEDVGKTLTDTVNLSAKLIGGGFAAKPGAGAGAVGGGPLLPVVPGGGKEDKAPKKTAAEKESERIAERQKDLVTDIANAHEAANAAVESGIELERTRMEQKLKEAKFSEADLKTLMSTYDTTQRLLEQHKKDEQLSKDRLQLSTELQESLNKQLYTEREIFAQKLTALGFTKEEAAVKLKMFDTEVRLREEAEKRKEAEKEAVQVSKQHLDTLERLQERLQPRKKTLTRAEELQGIVSEIATETSDPYQLQLAADQMEKTLSIEKWQEWRDFAEDSLNSVGDAITQFAFHGKLTFKDMLEGIAEDFFRMSLRMLMQSAFSSAGGGAGGGGGWLDLVLQAGKSLLGVAGGVGGAPASAGGGAITQTSFGGGLAAGGPVMPGKFYTVGERGPEIFMPSTRGTIIPNHQIMGAPTVVVNVHGVQDVQSFHASRGAVQRGIAGAVSQAYRGL
jgi:tape measure domain-containing protein